MENNFTTLQERIEQKELALTEALQREMQSLEKVEQMLNKRYSESVTNVLNSLRSNMEMQENELINEKMKQVSKQIETKSNEMLVDWERRMENTREKMSEVRKKMLKEDEEALKLQSETVGKMKLKSEKAMQRWEEATKEKADYTWLWIMMFAVWTIGISWGSIYLSQNPQILKSETKEITMKQVDERLKKDYTIEKLEDGRYLLAPKGEN